MPNLIVLCAPPGAGKSTLAKEYEQQGYIRISQDDQGKHSKLEYTTEIIVLHENREECFRRVMERKDHPTIKDSTDANNALNTFFGKYERPTNDEANVVSFRYPNREKNPCIVSDLDGTLCNIDHRLHFMKQQRKNWPGFFSAMKDDLVNGWCKSLIDSYNSQGMTVVLASGRPDNYKGITETWLSDNNINYDYIFMRPRNDSRRDDIVKEIILDFEILTRWKPLFFVDDRLQVVQMWRRRGFTCLACDEGDF